MKHSWLALSAVLLLVPHLASCQFPSWQLSPLGYHRLGQNDLTPHAHSHLTFPEHVDQFDRGLSWQMDDDERHVRVTYSLERKDAPHQSLTVLNSSLGFDLAFETKIHRFIEGRPGAVISGHAARTAQPWFPGWRIVVFDYLEFMQKSPPEQRYQPRRILIAARTFHDQTVFIETAPMYDYLLADFIPAVSQFASHLFPHGSSHSTVTTTTHYSGK